MSSPSPKSFRSRMGGVMRRTSSVLAISRPTTPTPVSTPVAPSEESRRASISKSLEGRKSTASLTPSGATPPAPVPVPELQPQPPVQPAPPVVALEPAPEPTPAPAPPAVTETPPSLPAPVVTEEPTPPAPSPTAPQVNGTQANGTPKAVKRLLPIAAQYQMYPSPIAESPAREAEASAEEAAANAAARAAAPVEADVPPPSRMQELVVEPIAETPAPAVEDAVPSVIEAAPVQAEVEVAPPSEPVVEEEAAAYVPPPPMLDSSNPGAFTDEPEDMQVHTSMPEPDASIPPPEQAPPPMPIPIPIPIPALDEPAYFDLVPAAPVHPVAAASPASGSETVVGADEHRDALVVEPYPYEMRPAPEQEEEGVFELPVAEPSTPPMARQWEEVRADTGGWVADDMVMPAPRDVNEDPFADPAPAVPEPQPQREGEDDSTFMIPIAIVDPNTEPQLDPARGLYPDGGLSSIPMPTAQDGLAAPLGYANIFFHLATSEC
ncbi:hypothetical protein C8R46DRAFT_240345 [Mycena filopes]|nr:hypothetical protein C8R46DRAFT_240345 [Mycena filopes]